MAERMVKDQLTGEKIPKSQAWQHPTTKLYYTSKAAYDSALAEKEAIRETRQECLEIILTLLDLPLEGMPPKQLMKDLKALYDGYGMEAYSRVVHAKKDYLEDLFKRKEFSNEHGKQRYLVAVLSNHIADERANMKREQKVRNIADVEAPDVGSYEIAQGTSRKYKDMSRFFS